MLQEMPAPRGRVPPFVIPGTLDSVPHKPCRRTCHERSEARRDEEASP